MTLVSLLLIGCANSGRKSEGQCVSPRLLVSPVTVSPGDSVTITWDGFFDCQGEPLFPGATEVNISLAEFNGYPSEPILSPSPAVAGWVSFSIPTTPTPGPSPPSPSTTATVPEVPGGQYYVYVDENFLFGSAPFTILG
jgi:hypothetical protein